MENVFNRVQQIRRLCDGHASVLGLDLAFHVETTSCFTLIQNDAFYLNVPSS